MAARAEVAVAATDPKVFHVHRRSRLSRRDFSCLVAGLGALAARQASAQSFVDVRYLDYQESNGRIHVQEPIMLLHQDLGATLGLVDLTLTQDTISGASPTGAYPTTTVSTTTGASGGSSTTASGQIHLQPMQDVRKAIGLSYSRKFGAHLPTVDLSVSTEHDYVSHTYGISDQWTLFEGRGTLHYGLSVSKDMVDPILTQLHLPKRSNSYALGWTWVLGEYDLLDISATLTKLHGDLDEPYLIVPVGTVSAPDHRPDARSRQAYLLKYGHCFEWDGAIKGSYRFYKDDWGLRANTLDFTYDQHIDDGWILSPRLRWYSQNGASFYGASFTKAQPYASADYRLSPMSNWLVGLLVSNEIVDGLTLSLGATFQQQTGKDRLTPLATSTSQGVIGSDTSPADFNTNTIMVGLKWRF